MFNFFNQKSTSPTSGASGDQQTEDPHVQQNFADPELDVTGKKGKRKLARAAIIPDALAKTFDEYYREEIEPFLVYQSEPSQYQLTQIELRMSEESLSYADGLMELDDKQRADIAKGVLKKSYGCTADLDWNAFAGWSIDVEAEEVNDARPYAVTASRGSDLVQMRFYFYGEIVAKPADQVRTGLALGANETSGEATLMPRRKLDTILRITAADKTHSFERLPILIGRSSQCDLVLESPHISRLHGRIHRDGLTGQIVFENLSKSKRPVLCGTVWLEEGERTELTQDNSITLNPDADTPEQASITVQLIHANGDQQATLMPRKTSNPVPFFDMQDDASTDVLVSASAPDTSSLKQNQRDRGATLMPRRDLTHGASTQESSRQEAARGAALAMLNIRYPDGRTQTHEITQLPLVIGRDPKVGSDSAIVLRDPSRTTSSEHLCIKKHQGGRFVVENFAHLSNGSFQAGMRLGKDFIWKPGQASGRSFSEWVLLGQPDQAKAIAVQLVAV